MARTQTLTKTPTLVRNLEAREVGAQLLYELGAEREAVTGRFRLAQGLIEERDRAREQTAAMRELAERTMAQADAHEQELARLKALVAQKDERIKQLSATLKMIAEADENS